MSFGAFRRFCRWSRGLLLWWVTFVPVVLGAPASLGSARGRVTAVSQSGQFVVVGPVQQPGVRGQKLAPVGDKLQVPIHPDLLAVTCERVRRAVNLRLGAPDRAGLPVHFELRPAHFEEGPITVHPRLFRDGWKFFAELPDSMDWTQLVRLLVEADVLEQMNRENPSEPVIVPPLWLTEGLTGLLLGEVGRDLVTESQTVTIRASRHRDAAVMARDSLGGTGPLSFSELAQPVAEQLGSADSYGRYRASATLFVHELLREDRGRKAIREFIRDAHRSLNWQTTFLAVSAGQFRSLLDVEKWWAVASGEVVGRGPSQFWPADRVISELAVIMTETADLPATNRTGTVRRTLPLREVIQTWDFPAQRPVLRRKVSQLHLLLLHTPPEWAGLVGESNRVLDEYLTAREAGGKDPVARMELETRLTLLVRNTVRRLGQLDEQIANAGRQVRR